MDRTRDRAHGRLETRTVKALTVHHFGFPTPRRQSRSPASVAACTPPGGGTETAYVITSLTLAQAGAARLPSNSVGHWQIENRLHWVRDMTFAEDGSQARTGTAPQVVACLRNIAIGALSRAGPVNLAAALRHHSRDPRRPLATLGINLR